MTRWILAATAILGLGAFGTSTAVATDWNDVQSEWRDYQRELNKGHFRHAQREYREYCRKLAKYNRERGGGYYAPVYGGAVYGSTTYYTPMNGTTVYYSHPYGYQQTFYSQPYYYPQPGYYYQQPGVAVGGGVTIWR